MGYQVIKQPDGKLALFSSFTDTWALYDGSPQEIVGWFAERAAEDARREAQRVVDLVVAGKSREAYYQFARTFAEANESSKGHDGIVWSDGWPDA